jgi:hypothetical protein
MTMRPTSDATSTPAPSAPAYPIPGFIGGTLTKLRPVLEPDLPALARLMSEAPRGFSWEREPWTAQRLKKEFEDEKEPGLWGRTKRVFAVTTLDGTLVGVLREELERLGAVDLELHIAQEHPDRAALGRDALAAYVEYKRGWQYTPRIGITLLEFQDQEREWALAAGFEHDLRCREAWLHRGEYIAFDVYAWRPDWVKANRAPDGIGQ